MSAILRLYPRAWRERYGDEILALLDERPPTLTDRFDLLRGAFDARLHPSLPGAVAPAPTETTMKTKRFRSLAAIGGIAWIIAVAAMFAMPPAPNGETDGTVSVLAILVAIAATGVALSELGSRPGSTSSAMTGHVLAIICIGLALTLILPWPALAAGYLGFAVVGVLAAVRLVANGRAPVWFVIVYIGSAGLAVGAAVGVAPTGALPLLPMGLTSLLLAWLAIVPHRVGPATLSEA